MLPCQDTPAVKATYSAKVRSGRGLEVLMSALRKDTVDLGDGVTEFVYEQVGLTMSCFFFHKRIQVADAKALTSPLVSRVTSSPSAQASSLTNHSASSLAETGILAAGPNPETWTLPTGNSTRTPPTLSQPPKTSHPSTSLAFTTSSSSPNPSLTAEWKTLVSLLPHLPSLPVIDPKWTSSRMKLVTHGSVTGSDVHHGDISG